MSLAYKLWNNLNGLYTNWVAAVWATIINTCLFWLVENDEGLSSVIVSLLEAIHHKVCGTNNL